MRQNTLFSATRQLLKKEIGNRICCTTNFSRRDIKVLRSLLLKAQNTKNWKLVLFDQKTKNLATKGDTFSGTRRFIVRRYLFLFFMVSIVKSLDIPSENVTTKQSVLLVEKLVKIKCVIKIFRA